MRSLTIEIQHEVVEKFPDVAVGGFLVEDLDLAAAQIEGEHSKAAREALVQEGLNIQNLADDLRIAGWRSAFREMGLKPSTYKGSAEQLARRVCKGEAVTTPLRVVNLYCALSAKHVAPMGAYDLDRLPEPRVVLRFARPQVDSFTPLAGRREDMPLLPTVAVYASGAEIICWGFNYRDSKNTCLTQGTRFAVFFSEGVCGDHLGPLVNALSELRDVLRAKGARAGETCLLSRKQLCAVVCPGGDR